MNVFTDSQRLVQRSHLRREHERAMDDYARFKQARDAAAFADPDHVLHLAMIDADMRRAQHAVLAAQIAINETYSSI